MAVNIRSFLETCHSPDAYKTEFFYSVCLKTKVTKYFPEITQQKPKSLVYVKGYFPEDEFFLNVNQLSLKLQRVGLMVMGHRDGWWKPCKFIFL